MDRKPRSMTDADREVLRGLATVAEREDDDHFIIYVIDVTDHGIRPALLSVSIGNILRSQALPGVDFTRPDQVLHARNQSAVPRDDGRDVRRSRPGSR